MLISLVASPLNPVPEGGICRSLTSFDGLKLRYARWGPLHSPARGTIFILQGRTEFIEKYFETIEDLRRRGFAVAIYDLRGQGGSQRILRNRLKGHVDDFADYVQDTDYFVQSILLPDCPPPYYILAHSTGAAVALMYASRGRFQIDRMLLTAPLLGFAEGGTRLWEMATAFLRYVGLGEMNAQLRIRRLQPVQLRQFEANNVTSDQRRYERNKAAVESEPLLGIGPPTVSWANAAMRAIAKIKSPHFKDRVPMPVLILMAGSDRVVSNREIERMTARIKTCTYVRIPGAGHEIMMERDIYRDQFLAAFDAFIPGRLPEEAI